MSHFAKVENGVVTSVNLMTGWISARFASEGRTLDLNLSCDQVQHADGEPIQFRHSAPDRLPHGRLMAMMRELHKAGYQRLYLYSWPKPSGLHWRWHLFTGPRQWMQRSWREGWYGSGAEYNLNPVLGWGDAPGASAHELVSSLARFDPQGLSRALGRDEDHSQWFASVCEALLPNYTYSLGWDQRDGAPPGVDRHIGFGPGDHGFDRDCSSVGQDLDLESLAVAQKNGIDPLPCSKFDGRVDAQLRV